MSLTYFFCIFIFFQNVDVNLAIDGRSPIHYASDYGQADVIEYLISKGADVNVSI
jgi:ankyrin repeat protein